MKKYLYLLGSFICVGACSHSQHTVAAPATVQKDKIINHRVVQLKKRFQGLQKGRRDVIRITQLGDSHSAADLFTGRLRTVLQQAYGDAGIGWLAPLAVRGQRHDKITYQTSDWNLLDSRRDKYDGGYPMGGYVAKAQSDEAAIQLKPRSPQSGRWRLNLLVKDKHSEGKWKIIGYTVTLPTEIVSAGGDTAIGGIWLNKILEKGVIVETVAANGAQNTLWDKWQADWLSRDLAKISRSDMVILAYGTNEAFNSRLDVRAFKQDITRRIQQIRRALPKSVILIIGAPEAYQYPPEGEANTPSTNTFDVSSDRPFSNADAASTLAMSGAVRKNKREAGLLSHHCDSQRPLQLDGIQRVLATVAKQQGTLYWDWQQAMGGKCQVPSLIDRGLMQKDGIHFTAQGYRDSADKLIDYLQSIGLISIN
ncbi:MAG: hypothetical protein CR975_02410 [Gammaproteobacteria bacterium]|nr:MAG: hypothetical protein CR975_02410 [Gammaproteobacteria bacterium]